jgi:hypothetical protein
MGATKQRSLKIRKTRKSKRAQNRTILYQEESDHHSSSQGSNSSGNSFSSKGHHSDGVGDLLDSALRAFS